MDNHNKKWKTLWLKEKLHVLCNFFFCHYVFKKPSAAEASESVYMRKRVNGKLTYADTLHTEQLMYNLDLMCASHLTFYL